MKDKNFWTQCRKASDNRLINIALDEVQKLEQNEDMESLHSQRLQVAIEEMEHRGLDAQLIEGSGQDLDSTYDVT